MSELVLSKYRDPWTETHVQKARWVADYFNKMGREIYERGFHYWLVSLGNIAKPDGSPISTQRRIGIYYRIGPGGRSIFKLVIGANS